MKSNKYHIFMLILVLVLTILLIIKLRKSDKPNTEQERDTYEETQLNPAEVVENFYEWISGYEGNYLISGSYKTTNYLNNSLKTEIDKVLNSFNKSGYDPLICGQEKPLSFRIGPPVIEDNKATVKVEQTFHTGKRILPIEVTKDVESWKISNIMCDQIIPQAGLGKDETRNVIVLYFSNETRKPDSVIDCGIVYGVERSIDKKPTIENKLNELFKGPTKNEMQQGYSSVFNQNTKDILKEVSVVDSKATIKIINTNNFINLADSTCKLPNIISQIEETIKHDNAIDSVNIFIDNKKIN